MVAGDLQSSALLPAGEARVWSPPRPLLLLVDKEVMRVLFCASVRMCVPVAVSIYLCGGVWQCVCGCFDMSVWRCVVVCLWLFRYV